MPETKGISEKTFEKIKHHTEGGLEFWYARELQEALEYAKWGNFTKVIDKAKQAMKDDKIKASEHITEFSKKSSEKNKELDDMILSRTACSYIAQVGDKRKKTVAVAQQYFSATTSIPSAPKAKETKQAANPAKAPAKKPVAAKPVAKQEKPVPATKEKKSLPRSRQLKKVAKHLKKS